MIELTQKNGKRIAVNCCHILFVREYPTYTEIAMCDSEDSILADEPYSSVMEKIKAAMEKEHDT